MAYGAARDGGANRDGEIVPPPWMLEARADLRVRDQLGHASIEEAEGTYGHLERDGHETG